MLAGDDKNSVLCEVGLDDSREIAYSPYGHSAGGMGVLGYNGAVREAHVGWYLLGNGYRAFHPGLMRFCSPDSWSPFGEGGLNAYTYCEGDPVTNADENGHSIVGRFLGRILSTTKSAGLEDVPTALLKNTKARSVMVRPIQQKHVTRLEKMAKLKIDNVDHVKTKVRGMANDSGFVRQYEAKHNVSFVDEGAGWINAAKSGRDNAVSLHNWAKNNIGKKGITREAASAIKTEALKYDKLVANIRKGKSADWSVVREENLYRANKEKAEKIGNRQPRNHLGIDIQN